MIFTNRIILKLQNSEALTTKDLSRLARKIRPESMRVIARELLGLDDTAITMIAANCQDKSYELNFKILEKWRNLSPENNRVVRFLITITLLAMIALLAVQSCAETFIHNAIMLIDTSDNTSYNQVHWLSRTPYLSIKASNVPNLSASLSRCLTCKNLGYKHLQI